MCKARILSATTPDAEFSIRWPRGINTKPSIYMKGLNFDLPSDCLSETLDAIANYLIEEAERMRQPPVDIDVRYSDIQPINEYNIVKLTDYEKDQ